MSTALQRGFVLFNQDRHDLAAAEFRRELADEPENGLAHAYLSLCLVHLGQKEEAIREADEAVRIAPDLGFCHLVRGQALLDADRVKDAEVSAREAIRLEPADPSFHALLGSIALYRRNWTEALEAADAGLALDPTHSACLNMRGMALVQLGRREEALYTLGSSLADDPENPLTHTNQGWAYLHKSDPAKALEHFREALRLDPELEWARQGIVEALKARHLFYRGMLAFFLWMGRQSAGARWAIILGFVFGRVALINLAASYPGLGPFIVPILILSFGFMLMSWVASPLFNLVLRFNKFGRMALSREQTVESTWVGGCFVLATVASVCYMAISSGRTFALMVFFGLLVLPLAMTFKQPAGKPRRLAAIYTLAVAACAMPVMSLVLMGGASPFARAPQQAGEYFLYFRWGCVLSTWAASLIASRSSV